MRQALSSNHKRNEVKSTPGNQVTTGANAQVPNTSISGAKLIAEGETIGGSLATLDERRFFKFVAVGSKTRVIFRKRHDGILKILDRNEAEVVRGNADGDNAVTLLFHSTPNALYYVEVEVTYIYANIPGDFEVVERQEYRARLNCVFCVLLLQVAITLGALAARQ